MRKAAVLLLAAIAGFFPFSASAGTTTAKIHKVLIYEAAGQGMVYIYPVGGVNNPPACHGSNGDYYSFAMDRPFAREYYAMAVAAQISGTTVGLWGKGACVDQSVSETLNYLRLED